MMMCALFALMVSTAFAEGVDGVTGATAVPETLSGRRILTLGGEEPATLQRTSELRSFYYHAQAGEKVVIKVKGVHFIPEAFVRAPDGTTLARSYNREGAREIEVKQTFAVEGDYTIQVRAKGEGKGLFQIGIEPQPEEESGATAETGK